MAEALLEELLATLGSLVSVVAQQVTREVTAETRAWEEEIRTWDALQDAARRKLTALRKVSEGCREVAGFPVRDRVLPYLLLGIKNRRTKGSCKKPSGLHLTVRNTFTGPGIQTEDAVKETCCLLSSVQRNVNHRDELDSF